MKKRNGNKGFTLVEMVVVLAIIAILFTLAAISMNVVKNANVKAAAKRMASIIQTARTKTMAKGVDEGKITITYEGTNLYAQIGTGSKQLICNGNVEYTGPATIQFNTDGTLNMMGDNTTNIRKCTFEKAGRKYELTIYKETGTVVTKLL